MRITSGSDVRMHTVRRLISADGPRRTATLHFLMGCNSCIRKRKIVRTRLNRSGTGMYPPPKVASEQQKSRLLMRTRHLRQDVQCVAATTSSLLTAAVSKQPLHLSVDVAGRRDETA